MNNTINTMNNTTDREGCREGWGECKPKPNKKVGSGGMGRVNRKGGVCAEKLKIEKCLKCLKLYG